MKTMIRLMLAGGVLALALPAAGAFAEVVVIVNPANSITSLDVETARRIYLGKDKTFPNGEPATPGDQPEGSRTRAEFYRKVVEKSEAQMKAYWAQAIFSGKDTPPEVIGGDAAMRRWVARRKDAIGYIDSVAVDDSVKVVARLP
ncbi:MAG TPA: hypothetical protein VF203_11395 [Burkholderiales bacterium]